MPKKRKPKQAHKRTPTERTADLLWLEREYLRGTRNPVKLANMLATQRSYRISGEQIRYDLARLREGWREATKSTYDEHVQAVLAELEEQERELWAAWERSKLDEEIHSKETKRLATAQPVFGEAGAADGMMPVQPLAGVAEVKEGHKQKGQAGDPSFMRLILDIQIRRCKLLGLDRPQKVEVGHSGSIAATLDVDSLDLDLETRKKLLAAVRKSNGPGRV